MENMSEDKIKEIKTILKKHDYITIIQKSGDGCVVTFPYPKLFYGKESMPRLIECFAIQRGDKPGMWVNTSYDEEPNEDRFIDIPEYAFRLYIMCEITACNMNIPIDPELVFYIDENEKECEGLEDIINGPESEKEQNKEGYLYRLLIEARQDRFPAEYEKVAESYNVDEGYKIIRKFYK